MPSNPLFKLLQPHHSRSGNCLRRAVERALRHSNLLVNSAIILGLIALLFGLSLLVGEWRPPLRPSSEIDLSPWALPKYAQFSFARAWIAFFCR